MNGSRQPAEDWIGELGNFVSGIGLARNGTYTENQPRGAGVRFPLSVEETGARSGEWLSDDKVAMVNARLPTDPELRRINTLSWR